MDPDAKQVSRTVTVINPLGLHLRPADLFTKLANRYVSQVEVVKDGQRVNGKSVMDMLMLAATEGSQLELHATGSDAQQVVDALADLFAQGFMEMDDLGSAGGKRG